MIWTSVYDMDVHKVITNGASFHTEMMKKKRFSKSSVIFQKMRLFKIPGKSPILQISEELLFF